LLIVRICYNFAILLLVPFVLPIGYLIAIKKKEEKDFFQRIGAIKIPNKIENSIWIHCASVGEVRSIKHLIKNIRKNFPELSIVISTTTATGKEMAEKELMPDLAMLLPIENSLAINMLIDMLRCKAIFIVDTELWPNFIYTASKKVKLFMINARLSDKSFKSYYFFRFIFRDLLKKFNHIYTKSENDLEKFAKIKGSDENITCIGNLKFFFEERKVKIEIDDVFKNKKIVMASSTHHPEEQMFLNALKKSDTNFDKVIIAPRHLNRVEDIKQLLQKEDLMFNLYSEGIFNEKFIILDKFGLLERFYFIADKVFIGGSTEGTGGHNIFEVLQFEKVPAVGSRMSNFKEIFELAKKYNLVEITDDEESLADYLDKVILKRDFSSFFNEIKRFNKSTETVLNVIKELIND
jgi:3-deoxy-D-manno-octulosonic-acid transferase